MTRKVIQHTGLLTLVYNSNKKNDTTNLRQLQYEQMCNTTHSSSVRQNKAQSRILKGGIRPFFDHSVKTICMAAIFVNRVWWVIYCTFKFLARPAQIVLIAMCLLHNKLNVYMI